MNTQTFIARITQPKTMAGLLRTACTTSLLPLLLLLALPAAVQAQFSYLITNGTVTITGYTGSGGAVDIPDTINGLPVTSIGYRAFWECVSLTGVTIGSSVTSIGDEAFWFCSSLTSVTIGTNVTNIGGSAFAATSLTNVTIPSGVTELASFAFSSCTGLTSVTIPDSVTRIDMGTFESCTSLTSVAIPESVTNIGPNAFASCTSLTNVTIGNGVTGIGGLAFYGCSSLTAIKVDALNPNYSSVDGVLFDKSQTALILCPQGKAGTYAIPNSVTSVQRNAFEDCTSLSNITIPNSVTSIGNAAFYFCPSLSGVYFQGNAPSLGGSSVFSGDNNMTIYYLPGTTGWGTTFGGRPTMLWNPPTIQKSPQTRTAEAGSAVGFWVQASGSLPLFCVWYFNYTNLLSCSTNWELELTNVQFAQSGAYTVVVTNVLVAATSSPALLNVIAPVERRPVPGIKVTGQSGSLLNVDYADSLSPAPNWTPLGSVSLTSTPQYCFDLTLPLPPQRFHRAWQTGTPGVRPSLDLHLVPAITLTGSIGHSVRLDYINQFGPTGAWVTLATVPLTNTSQLYFDTSAWRQPQRLYRLVPAP